MNRLIELTYIGGMYVMVGMIFFSIFALPIMWVVDLNNALN